MYYLPRYLVHVLKPSMPHIPHLSHVDAEREKVVQIRVIRYFDMAMPMGMIAVPHHRCRMPVLAFKPIAHLEPAAAPRRMSMKGT